MSTFIAHNIAIEVVQKLRPIVEVIAKHDSNLADQIRRAATSVVLNLNEGSRRQKGNQLRAFEIAHGEAREVFGALECAAAWGYVVDASAVRAKLDELLAICWRLTHPRPRR